MPKCVPTPVENRCTNLSVVTLAFTWLLIVLSSICCPNERPVIDRQPTTASAQKTMTAEICHCFVNINFSLLR